MLSGSIYLFYYHLSNSYLIDDILELHHRHADQSVVAPEAVVLDGDVELIRRHLLLVPDVTAIRG